MENSDPRRPVPGRQGTYEKSKLRNLWMKAGAETHHDDTSPQSSSSPVHNKSFNSPTFELIEVDGAVVHNNAKPTLQEVDIVGVPRGFDGTRSAWLSRSATNQDNTITQEGIKVKEKGLVATTGHPDSHASRAQVQRAETGHEKETGDTTNREQEPKTGGAANNKVSPETVTRGKTQKTIHWLTDEGMLQGAIGTGRILLFEMKSKSGSSANLSIGAVALALLEELHKARKNCPERPIVFLGHDVGIMVIEKALMASSSNESSLGGIFRRTAGIIFLSNPPKQGSQSEQFVDLNYWDVASRTALEPEAFRYSELSNDRYAETYLTDFRKQLSPTTNGAPSAISLSRFQYLGKIVKTDDSVFQKVVKAITASVDCHQLLSAAVEGNTENLKSILNRGVSVNTQDHTGNTALHLAVGTDHEKVVKALLVDYEANVTLQNCEGCSALYLAVASGRNNVDVISLLLKKGARAKDNALLQKSIQSRISAEVKRLLEKPPFIEGPQILPGKKVWRTPAAPQSGPKRAACQSYRAIVAEFFQFEGKEKFLLEDPSVHELLYEKGPEKILQQSRDRAASDDSAAEFGMINALRCRWYHIPANNVSWMNDLFERMRVEDNSFNECQHDGSTPWSYFMRPQAREVWAGEGYAKSAVLFMPYLHYEKRCDQERMHQVIKKKDQNSRQDPVFGQAIHQWDVDEDTSSRNDSDNDNGAISESSYRTRKRPSARSLPKRASLESLDDDSEGEKLSIFLTAEKQMIKGYMYRQRPLHVRRTLDQSHYYVLNDTEPRDDDQVVLRGAERGYLSNNERPNDGNDLDAFIDEGDRSLHTNVKAQSNMVMVDQLWLWILEDTIVTSFPRKWTEPDGKHQDDVLDRLLQHLRSGKLRRPINTVYDLAILITTFCTNIFDRSSSTSTQLRLHDLFECSIGAVANKETKQFTKFRMACNAFPQQPAPRSTKLRGKLAEEKLAAISDIDREVDLLKEIKDIRDEICMVLKILEEQERVLAEISTVIRAYSHCSTVRRSHLPEMLEGVQGQGNLKESKQESLAANPRKPKQDINFANQVYQERHSQPDANVRDFKKMLNDADAVADALNHLLDLKQKQANAMEAKSARVAADATSKQGNTILFFTLVTIMFGSLSFVAAFFALNVGSFPKNSDGTTTEYAMKLDRIDDDLYEGEQEGSVWLSRLIQGIRGLKFRKYWTKYNDKIVEEDHTRFHTDNTQTDIYFIPDKANEITQRYPRQNTGFSDVV